MDIKDKAAIVTGGASGIGATKHRTRRRLTNLHRKLSSTRRRDRHETRVDQLLRRRQRAGSVLPSIGISQRDLDIRSLKLPSVTITFAIGSW